MAAAAAADDDWDAAGWSWEDSAAADAEEEEGYSKEPKPEPDADSAISRPGPEATVLLVDCTAKMFETDADGDSLFQKSIRLIHKSLIDQMTRRSPDLVSIILFGTKQYKNVNDYDNIYVLNELDVPSTDMVAALERTVLAQAKFTDTIGWGEDAKLHDALWLCKKLYTQHGGKLSSRQILVMTTTDKPFSDKPGDQKLREVVLQRAADAKEERIEINVLPLCQDGQVFDVGAFYSDIISAPAPSPLVLSTDDDPRTEDVHLAQFKSKVLRRRPTMVVPFTLFNDGPRLGVRVYALRKSATKSSTVPMLAADQLPLGSKVRYVCSTTEKMIRPEELKSAVRYGAEWVVFSQDEVRRLKRLEGDDGSSRDVGLTLIGFKPRDRLKRHFNVKGAQFVYPDESVIRGSTKCFNALRDSCVRLKKVAVCRLIGSRSAEPRFVMLAPTTPGDGAPVGFHMVYLPYKDDMRKPQVKIEPCKTPPTDEQVAAVSDVIGKLTSSNFDSRKIHNPALARYNKMLETLAFDRDKYEPPEDETMIPESELMELAGPELTTAISTLFPDGYDAGSAPAKRKAGGGETSRAKKPKAASDFSNDEMKDKVKDGTWKKLTVPVLKAFCGQVGIKTTGLKKADLVAEIESWATTA